MTRTFSDRHPKVLPACNFLSQYYFCNIFLQKSCRFSLQTLTKFEAAKTGSGIGFLRLTAVCLKDVRAIVSAHPYCVRLRAQIHMPRHARARAPSAKMNNDRADGHCYSFARI